jgi:hypothetical protein
VGGVSGDAHGSRLGFRVLSMRGGDDRRIKGGRLVADGGVAGR